MTLPRPAPSPRPGPDISTKAKIGIGCATALGLAIVLLMFIGVLADPPVSEPEQVSAASTPSPTPTESPSPAAPDVVGLDLPEAEEELNDADFILGDVELVVVEDDVPWNQSSMSVCSQQNDGTLVDLGVAPDGIDCPESADVSHEWPELPDFVDDTVSEAQEWAEGAGISDVEVSAAFGDSEAPALEDAADHLVCEQSPRAAERTAPYPDNLSVELYVVAPGEECPDEIGDPRPEPEPEPEPEPAPAPQPAPQPDPAPEPAPQPEPEPETPSYIQGVHPGAFCDEYWQYGYTSAGTLMQCKTTATDDRFRWRAA